jgi:hypothetical protein
MERPRVAARLQMMRRRGLLGLIRIGALLERQSELELSDDQLKKLLSIRTDMIHTKAKLTGDIRAARLELIYSIASSIGNVNPDQVRSALKNIYTMRLERKAATVDAFKKASDVLTSDQKDKLHEIALENLSEYEAGEEGGMFTGED